LSAVFSTTINECYAYAELEEVVTESTVRVPQTKFAMA